MQAEPGRWEVLGEILRKGGGFTMERTDGGREVKTFYAPYTFFAVLPGKDAFEVMVIPPQGANIYAEPSENAAVINRLSGEVVEVIFEDGADNRNWFEIRTPGGRTGFVKASDVVSPTDWRAGFVKHRGEWKMKFFVGGD